MGAALVLAVTLSSGAAAAGGLTRRQCNEKLVAERTAPAVAGTTPASVLASYAVLRRPQVAADVPPAAAHLARALGGYFSSFDPARTRLLSRASGSLYLVAGIISGFSLPNDCKRFLPAALWQLERLTAKTTGTGPGYGLVEIRPRSTAALQEPASFARSRDGFQIVGASLLSPSFLLEALVPDGVRAVKVVLSTGTISLKVAHNLALAPAPISYSNPNLRSAAGRRQYVNTLLPRTVTWLTAPHGAIVRVFHRPPQLVSTDITLLRLASTTPLP